MLRRIGKKTKTIAITIFLLVLTPTLVYFVSDLDETFDSRSKASGLGGNNVSCNFDPIADSTLSEYAIKKDISIGMTLQECFKETNTQKDLCKEIVSKEYAGMTSAFQISWRTIEAKQGVYDYSSFDEMTKFAKENNIKLHYFHILWSEPLVPHNPFHPKWLFPVSGQCGNWTKEQLLEIMKTRIQSIMKYNNETGGTVVSWNVVNEAFNEEGHIEVSCFSKIIGEDWVDKAFQYAREASPDATLVLNEAFTSELTIKKVNGFFNYVKSAKEKGIPIDAVGLQNHLRDVNGIHFEKEYLENLRYYFKKSNEVGVKVLITEMDIYQAGHTQEEIAALYKKVMSICLENDNCTYFGTWGISDQYSWLRNDKVKLPDAQPLLFDEQYQRKPAYTSVMEALKENTTRGCSDKIPINIPKLNVTIWDNFRERKLNTKKWEIYKSTSDVEVTQTSSKTLRVAIPSGSDKGQIKYGGIVSQTQIPSDFRAIASLYKPAVSGDGQGSSGISFTNSDKEEKSVKVSWLVSKDSSTLILTAKLPDGKVTEYGRLNVKASKIEMRLVRVGSEYFAKYKLAGDDDSKLITIGKVNNSDLNFTGEIRIFSNNQGSENKFPHVVTKIDSTSISWFDKTLSEQEVLYDNFSNLTISGSKWKINAAENTTATIKDLKYLLLKISAGSNDDKARVVSIESKESVPEGKNFVASTVILNPSISGKGVGETGLQFVSITSKERAVLKWVTGVNTNKLVFTVEDQEGKEIFTESVDLKNNAKEIQLRINRDEDGYVGMYREGTDDDSRYKTFSKKVLVKSSSDGKIKLFASNRGTDKQFPEVQGIFDKATLSYYK